MQTPLVSLSSPLVEHAIEELVAESIRLIPNVVAALVVLVVAAEVGELLEDAVERGFDRADVAGLFADSPLDGVVPGGVGAALGTAVRYYVFLVALLAVARTLGLPVLTGWLIDAAAYVPALVGGLLVLAFGVVAVDRVTRSMAGGPGRAVRLGLYAAVALVALETMGAGTGAVGTAAVLVAGAAVVAVAVAAGLGGAIAVGLGGREYVAENIEDWVAGGQGDGDAGDDVDGSDSAG
ncbi:MAG: hypothetical protein ABEH77_10325, partial [Halobacteriaceae archaeon]